MKPRLAGSFIALLAALPFAGWSWADDAKKPPASSGAASKEPDAKTPARKPPNPLLADPFTGEFEGDGLFLSIKPAGDKTYQGEIRRGGKTFPCKATREGDRYVGAFTFEEFSYEFTVLIEGATLTFTTDEKSFSLKPRLPEKVADLFIKPAPQDPRPPQPSQTVTPAPPLVSPAAPVRPPAQPLPVAPPVTPSATKPSAAPVLPSAPAPVPIDYSRLTTAELRHVNWTRFHAESFVVFEDTVASTAVLPSSVRTKVVFAGAKDGKPVLEAQQNYDGERWVAASRPASNPTEDSLRIDDLGYQRGQTRSEDLSIDKQTLRCQRTTYTTERSVKGVPMNVTADIWRCKDVDHAMLVMDLPEKRLLVEPDMVKVSVTIAYGGATVVMSQELETIRRDVRIGNQMVSCAVIKGATTATDDKKTVQRTTEYQVSHQVPGGLVSFAETEQMGAKAVQRISKAVEFGVASSAPPAPPAPPVPTPRP